MDHHFIDIGKGVTLKVEHSFQGGDERPLLVFLHEGLGSIDQWKGFPEDLSAELGLPYLAYDRYGYGMSDPRPRPWPAEFMLEEAVERLPALLTKLGLTQPLILIGHSDGGTIALLAAALSELNIVGVVSMAMHVIMEEHSLRGLREVRGMFGQPAFRKRMERYHGGHLDDTLYGWNDALLETPVGFWDIRPQLSRIACPVLVVQGDRDEFGTWAQVDAVLENVPGSQGLLLADCGHQPHLEKPGVLIKAIRNWLPGTR